jgi:hypothetical protein
MAPKRKFRKTSNLAKRVKVLEHKQKADDKNTEYKVAYYADSRPLDDSWASDYLMAPRTSQGVEGESSMTGVGNTRIGNDINLRHWSLEAYIALPKSTDGTPTFPLSQVPCRIIIADNLTDDSQLGAADVLQNPLSGSQSLISPYKNAVAGGKRYRILGDYKFSLTAEKDKRIKFRMKLPKSGRVLHFPSNTSVHPSDFNISVMSFANVSTTGSNHPLFTYTIKSRFTDA